MKAEQAKKLANAALEELESALKEGKSERLAGYLAMMGRFHSYSFGNILLIMSQFPGATRVAGYRAWQKLGRFVKKGQKGIVIIAPMKIKVEDEPGANENNTLLRFRAAYVFDVSQTEGDSLPELGTVLGDPGRFTDRLTEFVASMEIKLDYAADLGGPDGVSRGGSISVLETLAPAEKFSVITHELAHEMLHKGGDPRPSKTIRETEAEAVAFVVCQAIGLEGNGAAVDYIQLYKGDAETLSASLDRIQKTASEIIEAIAVE